MIAGMIFLGLLAALVFVASAQAKGGGKGGSAPDIPPPTPVPETPTVAKSVTARENQEGQARRARGNKSTILTSGLGLGNEASTTKPTLLGQ